MKEPKDGFREAKRKVIAALTSGSFLHEARNEIDAKNKPATGEISAATVVELIKTSTGRPVNHRPCDFAKGLVHQVLFCRSGYVVHQRPSVGLQ